MKMAKDKKQRVLAWPPREFQWIEDIDDLDRLSAIYVKLMALCDYFSTLQNPDVNRPAVAGDLYGYYFFLQDICNELSRILKIDHWTGEIGIKTIDERET